MTVEHLLLGLLDNASAVQVLNACGADLSAPRRASSLWCDNPRLPEDSERDTQPTLGFSGCFSVLFHVQSSGKQEVTGANVLVAIFSEQESQAVYFLKQQEIARIDVVNYISHGIAKSEETGTDGESESESQTNQAASGDERTSNLDGYCCQSEFRSKKGTDRSVDRSR